MLTDYQIRKPLGPMPGVLSFAAAGVPLQAMVPHGSEEVQTLAPDYVISILHLAVGLYRGIFTGPSRLVMVTATV